MTLRYALNIALFLVAISCNFASAEESKSSLVDKNDILTVLKSIESQCNELGGYLGLTCISSQMKLVREIWDYCKAVDCQETKRSLDDFNAYATEKMQRDLQESVAKARHEERTLEMKMDTVCSLVSAAFIAKGLLNFEPNKQLPGYEHSNEDVEASLLAVKEYYDVLFGFYGCLSRKLKTNLPVAE